MKLVRPILFFLIAALLASFSVAKDKKSALVRNITHARFVMLTTLHGNDLQSAQVPPEDVRAFQATDEALRKWGRYIIVYTPQEADLILVVRAGRTTSTHEGIAMPSTITIGRVPPSATGDPAGAPPPRPGSVVYGGEVGPGEDMLEIFDAHLGVDSLEHASAPLWRKLQAGGLQGKEPALVSQLRKEVEQADKEDAARKEKDDGKKNP